MRGGGTRELLSAAGLAALRVLVFPLGMHIGGGDGARQEGGTPQTICPGLRKRPETFVVGDFSHRKEQEFRQPIREVLWKGGTREGVLFVWQCAGGPQIWGWRCAPGSRP